MATKEEPASTIKRQGVKRKASSSSDGGSTSNDFPVDSETNSGSVPPYLGSDESCPEIEIPQCTCRWTQDTLNRLNITSEIVNRLSAAEIFSNFVLPSLSPIVFIHDGVPANHELSFVESLVDSCIESLDIENSPLRYLDVDDLSEINCSMAYSLMFVKHVHRVGQPRLVHKRRLDSWTLKGDQDNLYPYQDYFCQMFYTHGHRFSHQLMDMCAVIKKGVTDLPESMFESLFQEFAGMFGLLSKKQHIDTTFHIGNRQVTAKPDIVFPYFKDSIQDDIRILALCQVKPGFKEIATGSTTDTRTRAEKRRDSYKKQLDQNLLGQHGGLLLTHLTSSSNHALLGIIVQRTNVTFSHLSCTSDEIDNIQSGRPCESRNMCVHYSRRYNFLKAEDRKELIKAFLTLGLIQLTPYM